MLTRSEASRARASKCRSTKPAWTKLALLVVAGALTVSSVAAGAPPPAGGPSAPSSDDAQALALYRQSTEAYEGGRFQDAVDLLLKAYALKEEPVILFNLARAYEGMGDLPKAVDSYRRYLASDPYASDRKSIEQRITTLQKQLDDRATLERQRDEERRRAEQERSDADRERRRAGDADGKRHTTVLPWLVAGTGVASIGAGVVFGLVSRDRYQAAANEPYRAPALDDYSTAKTYATIANVAFVVGAVAAAAGTVWGILGWEGTARTEKRNERNTAALVVGPAQIAVVGSF